MKRPNMLIPIIIWEFITAFLLLIGISVFASFAFPHITDQAWGTALPGVILGLSLILVIVLFYIVIAIISGVGLLKGKEWGRFMGLVHAALGLVAFPIGTVTGILSIIYLTQPNVIAHTKDNN